MRPRLTGSVAFSNEVQGREPPGHKVTHTDDVIIVKRKRAEQQNNICSNKREALTTGASFYEAAELPHGAECKIITNTPQSSSTHGAAANGPPLCEQRRSGMWHCCPRSTPRLHG